MKRLLLHVCCAPCVLVPMERLNGQDFFVSLFFYNPNIHPEGEYEKRRSELEKFAGEGGMYTVRIDCFFGNYDKDHWFSLTKGLENEPEGGKRCEICYKMRMEETAKMAKERGFDAFAVSMTISPHKSADLINKIGRESAAQYGIEYIESDFKKRDGFKRSLELSKKYGFYRQSYCGCVWSKNSS